MRSTLRLLPESDDWRWQMQHAVRDLPGLEKHIPLSAEEIAGVRRAQSQGLPLSITPYYLSLIEADDPSCPIRQQCIPVEAEAKHTPGDLVDPLGEVAHEVAPYLVQRYPDRALLLVTDRCGVYCRFCTRSRMVGHGSGTVGLDKLEDTFRYLQTHPEIQEIIISGGDPLIMSDARIGELLQRVSAIHTIANVRMATRTPVTLPQRITPALCKSLQVHPCLWLMTHFNHPKELSPEAVQACRTLANHGIPVMNHTVLLKNVNDNARTLEMLFRGLVRAKVRPYYLLQADPVSGTGHLRTPIQAGIDIMAELQGRLSGIALPKFIVDTPGGLGKVPIGPNYIVSKTADRTQLRTFRGELVEYVDP